MRGQRHQMRETTTAEVRLDAVGAARSALQRGQPAALNVRCARRALLPIAQVVQTGDPGLEPAADPANVG